MFPDVYQTPLISVKPTVKFSPLLFCVIDSQILLSIHIFVPLHSQSFTVIMYVLHYIMNVISLHLSTGFIYSLGFSK